jgi:hypothetical protein
MTLPSQYTHSHSHYHITHHTYLYIHNYSHTKLVNLLTDFIDSSSQSALVLSNLGLKLSDIAIISDCAWPSWVLVLEFFLEGSIAFKKATVLVPSRSCYNFFGTSRISSIQWSLCDLSSSLSPSVFKRVSRLLRSSSLHLYSGSLLGFRHIFTVTSSLARPIPMIVLLEGKIKLRSLASFTAFQWRLVKHSDVGGSTSGKFWIGFSGSLRSVDIPPPTYCPLVMADLLEFAPKSVSVVMAPSPSSTVTFRSASLLPCPHACDTWESSGLFPLHRIHSSSIQVLAPSPFVSTKWGIRSFTTKEVARFLDAPVAIETRLAKAFPTHLDPCHPFCSSFPCKLLTHALWLTGYCSVRDGGFDLTRPMFTIDSSSGNIVSQAQFNSTSDTADIKAAKVDDAVVPVHLWNNRLLDTHPDQDFVKQLNKSKVDWSLTIIRSFMISVWVRSITKSFVRYLKITYNSESSSEEYVKDLDAGIDCIKYATQCTWWEWLGGSRLFFWRWPNEFKNMARDGIPVCWLPDKQPTSKRPQPPVHDKEVRKQMTAKLQKVRRRGYVRSGFVRSLIRFFAVPKGNTDIRMVYDGTASGFNDSVFVPTFGLPTVETLLRGTGPNTWMVDLDIGDMFLNFMLAEDARELVGIDLSPFSFDDLSDELKVKWERWWRCAMGLKVSPNHAIRAILFAEEFLKGDLMDLTNPFQTSGADLNLPGVPNYDPSKPWFSLVNAFGLLAAILAIYVDDERINAESEDQAWKASHQVGSRESYLGIQDAARKRRPPSQNPGAWAGSMIRTNGSDVGILISEERWKKTRSIIRKWLNKLLQNANADLEVSEMLSDRGFLIYIGRTYRELNPFFKGIHLTLDGWRKNRDDDGWRVATSYVERNTVKCADASTSEYPKTVKAVPRLIGDLQALKQLTESMTAPIVVVRSKRMYLVRYGFGDASGGGFGSSMTSPQGIQVHMGTWNEKGSKQSSNFRELGNLVHRLELEAERGLLSGAEIFMFTDNSTAESAFHNGTSSSPILFELIVRLRQLQLMKGAKIHLIHVSGKRMISQGTDGISRGNFLEGVMAGKDMLSFVPISLTAFERSEKLLPWMRKWLNNSKLTPLSASDWVKRGQGLGNKLWTNTDGMKFPIKGDEDLFVWAPPPCIAEVAVEYLRMSVHRRPQNTHVFVCPKLMTYKWRKALLRSCDFSFYVDPGCDHWSIDMHESLLIGIYLPLLPCYPWTFRRSRSVLEMERILRKVQKAKTGAECSILFKFFLFTRKLPSLQHGLVRDLLSKGRIR